MTEARVSGWFDSTAKTTGPGEAVQVLQAPDRVRLASPVLQLDVALDTTTSWHLDERSLTVSIGAPYLDGLPVDARGLAALVFRSGSRSLADLHGRYAVVDIDLTGAGGVRLVTDRFAVLPMCYAVEQARLSFADRADRVPLASTRELDPQALFNYVHFHVIPAPRTVFRGVHRLEAATELSFSRQGELRTRRTWIPRFARHHSSGFDTTAQRFRDGIRTAVEREASGASVGAFLSGGTDSSTVAGMLCKVLGRPAPTFSIGFDAAGYDEMAYARIAARHFGTDHHEYYVTPSDLCAGVPMVAASYDQPFGNSSALPAYYCARLAREHGVAKILAGDGGDELFGGNSRYAKQKVFEAYWILPPALRAHLIEPIVDNAVVRAMPLARKAASYVSQARVPMPARTETYNLLERFGTAAVFQERFLEQIDASEPAALQAEVYRRHTDAAFVDRMLAFDWRFTLADNDLPKVTGTTALAGLDVGFPLLDDALVDLSLELGVDDKVRGLQLRHFFKAALADFLPVEIIQKKKHGFGLPVGPWLLSDASLRGLARGSLDGLALRGIVRPDLVDDLFSSRLQEHPGYYGEMIWILMMLEQWLRASAASFRAN